MPTPKATAVLVGGSLIVGILAGSKSATPDTRFIRVPEVQTRVVTETETVTVHESLPESCTEAVALLRRAVETSGTQTSAVGEILLALQELNRVAYTGDHQAVNATVEILRREKDRLDTAVIKVTEYYIQLDSVIQSCEADVDND